MLQPGQVFNERYEIIQLLGVGGYATVYKALQTDVGRTVALKIYHASISEDEHFTERCKREAVALNALSHKNIVTVYHIGQTVDDVLFLVMEFVKGKSLRQLLNEKDGVDIDESIKIVKSIASALSLAHSHGIVHRDLKPDNILLVDMPEPNTVKIVDFGLAKILDEKNQKLTQTGELLGTSLYMSPEQCKGKAIDHRSDIFSLGVCFFEMLAGRRLFDADTAIGVMYKVMNEEVPRLSNKVVYIYNSEINDLLRKLLEKDPALRYQTMDEVLKDLDAITGLEKSKSRNKVSFDKNRLSKIGMAIAIALIFAASFFLLKRESQVEHPNSMYIPAVFISNSAFRNTEQLDQFTSSEFRSFLIKHAESKGPAVSVSRAIYQYSTDRKLNGLKRLEDALMYEDSLLSSGLPSTADAFFKSDLKPIIIREIKLLPSKEGFGLRFETTANALLDSQVAARRTQSARGIIEFFRECKLGNYFSSEKVLDAALNLGDSELARRVVSESYDERTLLKLLYVSRKFHHWDLAESCLSKIEQLASVEKRPALMVLVHAERAINYYELDNPLLSSHSLKKSDELFQVEKLVKRRDVAPLLHLLLAYEMTGQKTPGELIPSLIHLYQSALERELSSRGKHLGDLKTVSSILSSLERSNLGNRIDIQRQSSSLQDAAVLSAILVAEQIRHDVSQRDFWTERYTRAFCDVGLPGKCVALIQSRTSVPKTSTAKTPRLDNLELSSLLEMAKCYSYFDHPRMHSALFLAFSKAKLIARNDKDYTFLDFCTVDIPLNHNEERRRIVLNWETPPDQREVVACNRSNYRTIIQKCLQYGQYRMASDSLTKMRREFSSPEYEEEREMLALLDFLLKLELKPNDTAPVRKLCETYSADGSRTKDLPELFYDELAIGGLGKEGTKISRRLHNIE